MFVRKSEECNPVSSSIGPNLFVCGGSKLPEWVLTVDELDELRDSIDLVRPRPMVTITRPDAPDIIPSVMWRKKDRDREA